MAHFQLSVLFGLGLCIALINGQCVVDFQNGSVSNNGSTCSSFSDSALNNILTCSGIQLSDASLGTLSNLKAFTDSAFDLYTLLRSRLDVSLVASSINSARSNGPKVGALSDVDFARLWFQVKLSPFISSLSREKLSCLSQSSLSCLSFQALVKDLSVLIGPERQEMVYQNFIKPFLGRNTTDAGCVSANTTEWFLQNFQTFSARASLGDFKALKQDFNGLVVLDQLSPEQKAELIFQLEATASLNIDAIDQIFQSFLLPLTGMTLNINSVTSVGLDKNLTDFLVYLRPLGRFIGSCLTFAQTANISSVRNETIELLVNWTRKFDPTQTSINTFNISNLSEWFQIVVKPVMKKYLQTNQTLPDNDTAISTIVFSPEPQIADPVDICKVTSNNTSCLISQNGESLAKAVNCIAQSNLSFTEENLRLLITELSRLLQTQMEQSVTNSSLSNLTALFAELPADSFTSGNLDDVEFMRFWFQIKMKPLLPQIPREFLSCLRTRSFSCQVYNALFVAINNNSGLLDSATKRSILIDFIIPFLSQRQNTGVDCTLPFNNSLDFILQNFGSFFPFAQLQEISKLSRSFSAVEALSVLTLVQLNELVFSPPTSPANRTNILTGVFEFLLQESNRDKLNNFLPSLQTQARKANFSCENYKIFFDKMDQTLSLVPSNQSEALLTIRDSVMMIPPDECIERASQCTTTPVNESSLCASVNSSALDQFLKEAAPNATGPLNLCNFTVLQFACRQTLPQLNSQQVADVLACKQPSNVGKETWKLFFTKTSSNLDDALLKFSNMAPSPSNVSLSDVLDVLVDVRVDRFSPQRLRDPVFIRSWFQGRLKPFLPSVSQRVLSCLSTKNLTCESYRTIFVAINNNSGLLDSATKRSILIDFIIPFLSQRQNTGVDCTLPFNNSLDFILQNFGSFFPFAQLQEISKLSRSFSAVEALSVLTLVQLNELVFSPPTSPANRTNILTGVFEFLLQESNRDKLNNFLPSLQTQARKANFSCENYKIFFDKMDQTLSLVPSNQSEALLTIRDSVMMIPPDECIERASQCTTTPVDESSLCASVNSSALDQFLKEAAPNATGPLNLCNFTVLQFACRQTLPQLNSQQVADVLACKQPSNVGKETWKLFFTKTSSNLDDALLKFSNMAPSPSNVSLSDVLDVLVDVRVDRFSPQRLRDPVFIRSWFQGRLKPFLPSVSQRVLSCLSTKNLTCESYRTIFVAINNNSGLLDSATKRSILIDFIIPFLSQRQNTGVDCTLPFYNSLDFILQNFGSFFPFAQLQEISKLSRSFSAVEALSVLTPVQLNELVFSPPTSPANRTNILTGVFEFLLQESNRDKLNNFLPSLQTQARKANFSCENYKIFFDKMDQTLSLVPSNQSEALLTIRDSVMMIPPDECIERASQCTTTPVDESSLCASVNSSALDQFLKEAAPNATGPLNLCNFTVLQFACRQTLPQLNSQQVADVLACKQPSNVGKETWKLFFTKTSSNLDDALLKFSNMAPSPSNVSLSDVLDVLVDVRVDRFSPQRLRDPVFIRSWFQGRLKPFLPSVSQRVLSCLSTKNLTCESYRTIFVAINNNFGLLDSATKRSILIDFIVPFLSQRQNTGVDCTLPFYNSLDFILQNFGSFFPFAQLQEISKLSRSFSAVEALSVLTPVQLNELVFSPPTSPANRTNILTGVFEFLLQESNRDKLNNFLPSLQTQARKANFSCENYKIFFDKMDQTLSLVPSNQSEALLTIRDSVMMIPPDECIERASQCTTTPVDESSLCASVNSSALDQFLKEAAPNATGPLNLCNFTVLQFACLQTLPQLNSQQVADVLACKQPSNVGKETWKLFFTKTSSNLDDALLKFSNMAPSPSNVSLSDVLDVLVDVRVDRFSPQRLRDPVFIRSWFQGRLKPFLPSVSQRVLSCLSTKKLTCESYRTIFVAINNNSGLLDSATKRSILIDFIVPFLSQRQNTGVDCTLPFYNSLDFILQNFGSFFPFAQLQEISKLSRSFSAVEALSVLTPVQLNELVFSPPTSPANRTNILTGVFEFLLQESNRDKLNNFLPSLQTQARKANFSCENYKIFFDKMDQTLSLVPSNQSEALLTIRDSVMMIPPDECIERASQCTTTPVDESSLCASVNSSALDQFLKEAAPNATGPLNLCNFTVLQFACRQTLPQLNSQQVADVLACKQPSNVGKETWKLFFTKTSSNLDDALLKFSNMAPSPSNVSLSDVLDVLVDVRVDRFSPQRLRDPVFIRSWFQGRLKPFLPSVSQRVLSCLSTKKLTCESYRTIFVAINNNSGLLDSATKRSILIDFIVPFLSQRQNTGVDCTLPFYNSLDFILQNFGSFFPFAQLQEISKLSRSFSAVEALSVLTPVQLNELVFSPPTSPANRTNILTGVFEFLLQESNRDKLNNFLPSLQTQARKANFSCENYKIFFDKMDQTLSLVPSNQSEALLTIRDSVMMIPPDECIERASQCTTTPVDESSLCASVNSSALDQFLKEAARNATGPLNLCNFTVLQFACLQTLPQLNSQQVADVLACKQPSNVGKETWKLFFTKTSSNLDDALLKFSNMAPSPSNVSLSDVLDVLVDVRVDRFSPQRLRDPVFIRSWFQGRLKPFLPSVSQRVLSCLSTKKLTCESYRTITEAFVNATLRDGQDVCRPLQPSATQKQDLIYTDFMKAFLSRNDTDDPGCLRDTTNSTQWLNRNFGPFVQSAYLTDLVKLNRNFTEVEVLPLLSLKQLVEFSVSPGGLTNLQSVINIMQLVKDCQLPAFFDLFSPNAQVKLLPPDVKAALIKQIFDRASLSNLSITDQEVQVWFRDRLNPLLGNFSESLVSPFFTILSSRDCNITLSALSLLGAVRSSIPTNATKAIYNSILQSFRGPQPLRCYRNNSFITFLNESLFGFGPLPNLTSFLSLMPQPRKSELINSISPSELGTYLRQLEVVNNDSQICVVFNNFVRTPEFLDTEVVPDNLKSTILPCVWPLALTSDNQTVVDLWFDRRLRLYLKFLNTDILGSNDTLSASCLSYRKMVNVLGNDFNFNGSQISREDVYTTIKTYLKADTAPKCYNVSDAALNSTAWFVNHIGIFITFLSLDDLYSFGPESKIKIFTVNPENIKLFNKKTIPKNVLNRYTQLVFLQNPSFDLFDLPSVLQCDAPVSTFTKLNESQTNTVLENFKSSCSNVDPAISTALAGNIKTITANAISNLGNEVVGLTPTQINSAPPSVVISGLSTLSNASGWSFGQATAIIKVLISGAYKFNDSSSLLNLGSLIGGIPSTILIFISPEQILSTSKNSEFVKNMLSAPEIVQKTFVTQIIKLGSSPAVLMTNIPNEMAVLIPRNLMIIPTTLNATVLKQFNNKKWKPEQAVLFFDTVANAFENSDELSVDVLQGFTCSRVQTLDQNKVRGLIRACRRRENRPKVVLRETQLTCMYNLVRNEPTVDFASYHPDMLLYYNYENINKNVCKAYFAEIGAADFSIFSSTLRGRRNILWNNAVDCFGINGTSIKKQDLAVLGNLVCVANSDFIKNSDPEILENLKNCNDLSDVQISAMETVLMKGNSKYGPQSNWNQKTLDDLGILPLYFSQNFWGSFNEIDSRKFLKSFLKFVRVRNTPKSQLKRLFKAIILPVKVKRAAACSKDIINSVIINDDAFPFGYDEVQFSSCLNADVVRDNLASLCEKIEDSAFQRIVLDKLNEISPSGLSEDQVPLLKSVSRNATADEISKWNITKADTLAALMNANDGEWSSAQSKQIITKYLSANNSLTTTELNAVKGPNLCSLNAGTLSTISPESIQGADALDVSKCSSDNKKALFTIAKKAFPMPSVKAQSDIMATFQLIEAYLGGADLAYIRNLSSYNVSMSLSTFINLDANVISSLTVPEVKGLLGRNLQDLKTFENESAVQTWLSLQPQSELNKLDLGLTGGKVDTTTAPPAPNPTVMATIAATIKPTSGAPGIGRGGWSVSLSILVLIFTIIKVEII